MPRATLGTAALLLALPLIAARAEAQAPKGLVEEPRLTSIDVRSDKAQLLTFKGWVDFPGTKGRVRIIVSKEGDAAADDPFLFTEVVSIAPSNSPVSGTTNHYKWETALTVSSILGGQRWPAGGTARVRVRAVKNNSAGSAYLPVRDKDGVQGRIVDLVIGDIAPSPAATGNTPNYLNRKQLGSAQETDWYYQAVGTRPDGSGFNDGTVVRWTLPTLGDFKARYFQSAAACGGSTPERTARYFNKGDLGLGREMHCVRNACTSETACYVKNYGDRNGGALFDNRDEAKAGLDANKPFATVAMVERGQMAVGAPNKVFFVVYNHAQQNGTNQDTAPLAFEAPLDNKGFNKSIPQNCLVCHGTTSRYNDGVWPREVRGAFFLPFDLQAFEYFSSDSNNSRSRAKQEGTFRALNEIVYFTDLWFNGDANTLIDGWYGGSGWTSSTFVNNHVPDAWRNPGDTADDNNRKQLYKHTIAKSCRTCHISEAGFDSSGNPDPFTTGAKTWGSYDSVVGSAFLIWLDVCRWHEMPNAEQALKVFWSSSARSQLLNRLPIPNSPLGCGNQFAVTTAFVPKSSARTTLDVAKDFAAESCACRTAECAQKVQADRMKELPDAVDVRASRDEIRKVLAAADECRTQALGVQVRAKAAAAHPGDRVVERDRERQTRLAR
jgi:hypothetical protein